MSEEQSSNNVNMSLVDHLVELRTRLIYSAYALIIATGVCWGFTEKIFNYIRQPIQQYLPMGGLIYTGPMDKFFAHLKVAVSCGFIISCPFWIYQVWKFIEPGLYKKERNYALAFVLSGVSLFVAGMSFAYFVVLPMAFKFLMTFGGDIDKPMISIEQYLSMFTQTVLMFGLSFEVPLILSLLGLMGIVSHKFLITSRRYAIMALAVVSAIITPPDLLSMILMLVPMILLYEVGVFFVGFFERSREKEAAAAESETRVNTRE